MATPVPRKKDNAPFTRYEKDEVRYRKYDSCKACRNFQSMGSRCEVVSGKVDPNGVCDTFEPRTQEGPIHAEFYKREYDKLHRKS